ncbi:MAG: ATP-binding protein [Cyanobacteria bacterium P01_G01_bin.54]
MNTQDLTLDLERLEQIRQSIDQGLATVYGEDALSILVRRLAESLDVKYAFIGQLDKTEASSPEQHPLVEVVAMWGNGNLMERFSYQPIPPCLKVLGSFPIAVFPQGIREQFPNNPWLSAWELESYIGLPLFDRFGRLLGLLSVMDTRPMESPNLVASILQRFAVRAAAELAQQQVEVVSLSASATEQRLGYQLMSTYSYAYALRATNTPNAWDLVWITESVRDMTGFTEAELQAMGWQNLLHPEDRELLNQQLQALEIDASVAQGYRIFTKSGQLRWFWSHHKAIAPEPADLGGYQIVGAAYDITESQWSQANLKARNQALAQQLRERSQQLQEGLQRLAHLERRQDDFLNRLSESLRTPLTNMRVAIHMLQLRDPPGSRDYLRILHTECEREIAFVDDLLNFQPLDEARFPKRLDVLDLELWLPRLIDAFRLPIRQHKQRLSLEFEPNLPHIAVDRFYLQRILTELLGNACKFTLEGGEIVIRVTLEVSVNPQPDFIFTVRNQAEIPQEEQSRVFAKFYQIPQASPTQGGTGLGLALVKLLAERMGGKVLLRSQGGWTDFSVYLPPV